MENNRGDRLTARKTAVLALRLDPLVKSALCKAAEQDRRSITALIEALVTRHCQLRPERAVMASNLWHAIAQPTLKSLEIPKRTQSAEIHFYRANERPYGVFSNLYRRPVILEGRVFPTAEHAYQAGKPRKDEVREWILQAPSPALLAMAAHGLYSWDIVEDGGGHSIIAT